MVSGRKKLRGAVLVNRQYRSIVVSMVLRDVVSNPDDRSTIRRRLKMSAGEDRRHVAILKRRFNLYRVTVGIMT